MKLKYLLVFSAVLSLFFCGTTFAQVCTASGGALSGPSSADYDLCSFTDQLAQDCGNATNIGNAPDAIFSFTLPGPTDSTFTVTPASTYQAYVGIMSGATCNSTNTCGSTENESGSNGSAVTTSTSGLAAGSYFLIVSNLENTTCGSFTLAVSAPLPVKLQNFSVN